MILMQNSSKLEKGWEFAQVQMVKGAMGGLYLTYMTNETPCKTYKVRNSNVVDDQESDPPLFQLLAQMGAQNWDIIQHSPPNYLLKRPIDLTETVLQNLDLEDYCVK